MELSHLEIRDFRNMTEVRLTPGRRFNVVSGMNGQGKTNLLEAVYVLGAVKSLRAQKNGELIRWGASKAVVSGEVEHGGHVRQARVEVGGNGKRVYLNDLVVRSLTDFFGTLNCVVFAPDDLMMLKGGPSERRRFLDRAVFNARASFFHDAQAYEAVLKQRNALLKQPNVHSQRDLLEVYDEQLAQYGSVVVRRRLEYLREFQPIFLDTFVAIFSGGSADEALLGAEVSRTAAMGYVAEWLGGQPLRLVEGVVLPELEGLRAALAAGLRSSIGDDLRRGFTGMGPHRDDLALTLLDRDARSFASQGQMRAMVLAMKITEIRVLTERFGYTPVLLLDDVSSELDHHRNRYLFEMLGKHPGQVFITTTHRDHIKLYEDVTAFEVHGGTVRQVE